MGTDNLLFERLRDLATTLPEDIHWLADVPLRADGLRDLGERLLDLGATLIAEACERDRIAAQRLPPDGWIPEAGPSIRRRMAHYVGRGELRVGTMYLASCGATCFPFYGKDSARKIGQHERCAHCQLSSLDSAAPRKEPQPVTSS